jgi:hypothetical protein
MTPMKLRNADKALVPKEKITEYLLNDTHPANRGKSAFFFSFGFTIAEWELLAKALFDHATANDIIEEVVTEHGAKYIIEGVLSTPDGRMPEVRSVWIIDQGESTPRLVTAYRLK